MLQVMSSDEMPFRPADYSLDITHDVCPMTFVKTKLLIEKMNPLETAEIRLNAGEPLENVPRSLAELGHRVLGQVAEDAANPAGVYRLLVQKAR